MDEDTCSVPACTKKRRARRWCQTHYMRWYHHGDPLWEPGRPPAGATALQRYEFYTRRADGPPQHHPHMSPCLEWTGHLDKRGYGRILDDERWLDMAHRWAYKHFVGPIPEGLSMDHLCHNPKCVDPEHLEPVTPYENTVVRGLTNASAVNARKTHCKWGHEFTPENTYIIPSTGGRFCRKCGNANNKRYKERKKAAQRGA